MEHLTDAERALQAIEASVETLRQLKPNGPSEQGRYWAITVTELEKALAIFKTFVADRQPKAD